MAALCGQLLPKTRQECMAAYEELGEMGLLRKLQPCAGGPTPECCRYVSEQCNRGSVWKPIMNFVCSNASTDIVPPAASWVCVLLSAPNLSSRGAACLLMAAVDCLPTALPTTWRVWSLQLDPLLAACATLTCWSSL